MAAAAPQKLPFSASSNGAAIAIAATATPGTLIHTAQAGTTAGNVDEVWVWVSNPTGSDQVVTVEWSAAGSAYQTIVETVSANTILLMVPGFPLQNGLVVRVFAAATGLFAQGFVNRIVYQ